MTTGELTVGAVVYSKMGRDSGKYYVVTAVKDEIYVTIADGELRKVDKPKLKKVKHLKWNGETLDAIAEKLIAGKQVFDSEIRSALRKYNDKTEA